MSGRRVAEAAASGIKNMQNNLHVSAARSLPKAATLRLPENVQDINASEMGRFSPLRTRDISGSFISSQESWSMNKVDITLDSDPHIGPYDCRGALSLSSSMQSNVPSPFGGNRQGFLGMPGAQWGHGQKYLAEHLQTSHYLNLRNKYSRSIYGAGKSPGTTRSYHSRVLPSTCASSCSFPKLYSRYVLGKLGHLDIVRTINTDAKDSKDTDKKLSRRDQLKQAVAAYGSTVMVFHVTISLASLGVCYLLVSSGLDVTAWMEYFGLTDSAFQKKIAGNAGTFVVAYAIHKVFAPVRIGITLTATPFIVKYLRNIGILKKPIK